MGGPAVAIRKVGVSQLCWKSGHHLKATLRIRNGTNIQLIELRKTGTIQITDNADERFRRGVIAQNKTPGKVASRGANHGQQLNLHFLGITSPQLIGERFRTAYAATSSSVVSDALALMKSTAF